MSDQKLDDLGSWRRTRYLDEIGQCDYEKEVNICGWVQDIRKLGGISFLQLRDRTGIVQVTAIKEQIGEAMFERISNLARESVIGVRAKVVPNAQVKKGFEAIPIEVMVFSEARTPLPLGVVDKVFADLETRLDNRFLDLRKLNIQAIFRIRNAILKATREVFEEEGFWEIHTPKIVATATEGGTDLFAIKYFERDAYLNQSPQLFKQIMMSAGFDRVFEIGPAFRAEKHNTVRHINEFISIDVEMSFTDEEGAMGVLERLIKRAYERILERHGADMALVTDFLLQYNKRMDLENQKINQENKAIKEANKKAKKEGGMTRPLIPLKDKVNPVELKVPTIPFPRITYKDALELIAGEAVKWNESHPDEKRHVMEFGDDFSMEETKVLAKHYPGLYFITRWPTVLKPFYVQPYEPDPTYSRGFDLMCGEKEITSGAQRVHNPQMLIQRLLDQGLDPDDFKFYLDAFYFGMPPHAGWGLGLERTAMIITGVYNIRETILFPRDRTRLTP